MSKQLKTKPLAAAVGAVLATSVAAIPSANADTSPFNMTSLASGYMVAAAGEGSCGGDSGDKKGEGSCGEGSCGGDKGAEGSCGGDKEAAAAAEEAAESSTSGSGSTGALTLLGLLSAIGLRRRIKRG